MGFAGVDYAPWDKFVVVVIVTVYFIAKCGSGFAGHVASVRFHIHVLLHVGRIEHRPCVNDVVFFPGKDGPAFG